MELQFENNLEHQNRAIEAVINLFEGIDSTSGYFTLKAMQQATIAEASELENPYQGVANQISQKNWFNEIAWQNLLKVQQENAISSHNNVHEKIFDIEMETGTGKTYVFLKTIFELHQKYEFKKFIILVPSIAIKEGVKKNLEITKKHFKNLYHNVNYHYYDYDGDRPEAIHDFAHNNNIEIMIMNIHQINKSLDETAVNQKKNVNNIYKHHDRINGQKPIDLLKKTQPILIIDEPQSTSSGIKSIKAIKELNPLFTLRYSATFKKNDQKNLLYKLDCFDAYEQKLVKEITVISHQIEDKNAKFKLLSLDAETSTCKIELYKNGKLTKITFKKKDNLYEATNNSQYENYVVGDLYFTEGKIDFTNGEELKLVNHDSKYNEAIKRELIKKTIQEHLNRELSFYGKADQIKVLSLFFLDRVSNYREYYEKTSETDRNKTNLNWQLGKYAKIFEEEFIRIASRNEYKKLFEKTKPQDLVDKVHDGYFSMDRKKQFKDTKGDTLDDRSTYDKIMKDKERLLSLDEPLKFIFSHSALKEGWDNPNVFQICTLNDEVHSEIKKRQQIGRGLRLCVNQKGQRIYDSKINQLSIIANGSFEKFASDLQKEYRENGISFKKLNPAIFTKIANLKVTTEESGQIFEMLITEGILDVKTNEIKKNNYDEQLIKNKLEDLFPNRFNEKEKQIIVDFMAKKIEIKNGNKRTQINKLKKDVLYSPEFKQLWEKIKFKTIYKIKFDTEEFISKTQEEIKRVIAEKAPDRGAEIFFYKDKLNIDQTGIKSKKHDYLHKEKIKSNSEYQAEPLRDFVTEIEEQTHLTKKTIAKILKDEMIINFIKKANYSQMIKTLVKEIESQKLELMIKGIEYSKIENDFYQLSQFEGEIEIPVYESDYDVNDKERKFVKVEQDYSCKYPYYFIETDSKVEVEFAEDSLSSTDYKKFIKLPKKWFRISTPLGNYSPDWALYHKDSVVFVTETKGNPEKTELRTVEHQKIDCARKHFQCLQVDDAAIEFKVESKLKDL